MHLPSRAGPRKIRARLRYGVMTISTRLRRTLSLVAAPLALALYACSAPPDGAGGAESVSEGRSDAGTPRAGRSDDHSEVVRVCLDSPCNASCAQQPGVAGGQCENGACVCAAPTCGQLLQPTCAGGYCAPPLHLSAVWGLCASCGQPGEGCCSTDPTSPVTACFGGTQCIDSFCQACGGVDQPACPRGAACNDGLVAAVQANGEPVCLTACGSVGQQECVVGGCTQPAAVLDTTNNQCTENPGCGHVNQGCCNQGNYFQGPNSTTDICWPNQGTCEYEGLIPGLGSWQCKVIVTCGIDDEGCGD